MYVIIYLIAPIFFLSLIFREVQLMLCRKAKHPVLRHILQVCAGIAVILAFLFECDVFSRNQLRDFNETVAAAIFYGPAAAMLLGSTAAWLFDGFRGRSENYLLTIPAGVIGLGIYQLLSILVLNESRWRIHLMMWGIMAVVFVLLSGVNAVARQIRKRKQK
jgi:hypothetical protein